MSAKFEHWFIDKKDSITKSLCDYIALNTISPNEYVAFPFLHSYFQSVGCSTWEEQIDGNVFGHPLRCQAPLSKLSDESRNFRASLKAKSAKSTVLISSHIDVVPADNWRDAFNPRIVDDIIFGRGACDTKCNLIIIVEALRFLQDSQIPVSINLEFDGVIEEEIGGAGALSTGLRNTIHADEVIVLEPTSLECFRGHRGCIGFSVTVTGQQTHMGAAIHHCGPVQGVARLIDALEALEKTLIAKASQEAAFNGWQRPVQVNIGRIEGGEWHGSTISSCRLLINMGFPPSISIDEAMDQIRHILKDLGEKNGLDFCLSFDGIRNDAYLNDQNSIYMKRLADSLVIAGLPGPPFRAWNVSCDARTYAKFMGLPTAIFGCGQLKYAHSNEEQISIEELRKGIYVLSLYFSGNSTLVTGLVQ